MKKVFLLGLVLAGTVGLQSLSAIGIGIAGGAAFGGNLPSNNLIATYSEGRGQVILGLGAALSETPGFGVSVDYWIRNNELIEVLGWYVGIGGYVGVRVDGDNSVFVVGARLPLGLNVFLLDEAIEFYAEIAPLLGVGSLMPTWGFQGSVGMRVWTD